MVSIIISKSSYKTILWKIENTVKSRLWLFSQKSIEMYFNLWFYIVSAVSSQFSEICTWFFQETLLTATNSSIKTAEVSKQQWTLAKGLKRHCGKTCNISSNFYSFWLWLSPFYNSFEIFSLKNLSEQHFRTCLYPSTGTHVQKF